MEDHDTEWVFDVRPNGRMPFEQDVLGTKSHHVIEEEIAHLLQQYGVFSSQSVVQLKILYLQERYFRENNKIIGFSIALALSLESYGLVEESAKYAIRRHGECFGFIGRRDPECPAEFAVVFDKSVLLDRVGENALRSLSNAILIPNQYLVDVGHPFFPIQVAFQAVAKLSGGGESHYVPHVVRGPASGRLGSGHSRIQTRFRKGRPFSFVLLLLLFVGAVIALYQTGRPLEKARKLRIALLPCASSDFGGVMPEVLLMLMEESDLFTPVRGKVANELEMPSSAYQRPNSKKLDAICVQLGVNGLLFGRVFYRKRQIVWEGLFYLKGGTFKKILVSVANHIQLMRAVLQICTDVVVPNEKKATSMEPVFSEDMLSNMLYSEAIRFYRTGNIGAAMPLFGRISSDYDVGFHQAKIMWAKCLLRSGNLPGAKTVLRKLLQESRFFPDPVRVDIYYAIADVYALNLEYEELASLLKDAKRFTFNRYKLDYFRFRVREVEALFGRGEKEQALSLMTRLLIDGHSLDKNEFRVELLLLQAKLSLDREEKELGLSRLNALDSLMGSRTLSSKHVDIILRRVSLKLQNGSADPTVLVDLNYARQIYPETDRLAQTKITYYFGAYFFLAGELDKAFGYFEKAYRRAEALKLAEYEVRSKLAMVEIYSRRQQWYLLKKQIATLSARIVDFPNLYVVWILDVFSRISVEPEFCLMLLKRLEQSLNSVSEKEEAFKTMLLLQEKSKLLAKLGRREQADQDMQRSIQLREVCGVSIYSETASVFRITAGAIPGIVTNFESMPIFLFSTNNLLLSESK